MMKILFCKIAWMKYYRGVTDEDKPQGGGKYVEEHEYGAECANFLPIEHSDGAVIRLENGNTFKLPDGDVCIGYVASKSDGNGNVKSRRIERIEGCEACAGEDFVNDVLVVFCAPHPDKAIGSVVVGWYNRAAVFRNDFDCESEDGEGWYFGNIVAKNEDAVLLPVDSRKDWHVPQARRKSDGFGFGMDNNWYAGETRSPKAADDLKIRVKTYVGGLIKRIRKYEKEIGIYAENCLIHCENCGNELPPDANFCDKCGSSMKSE